jgi:hypothetical protein
MERNKNIHVLPTDKPSRLHYYNSFDGIDNYGLSKKNLNWKQGRNIYITSDEEIKEGDWCYYENGDLKGIHKVVNGQRPKTMILKKIILTTDQDLIKDGVQSIDDEFLEWFVKNPSCEFVEIQCRYNFYAGQDLTHYKIIIPSEEPKQETLEEVLGSSMCQFSVIENKLAILYRNQVKIYDAITKEQQSYSEEDLKCAWDSSDQNMRFQFSSSAYKGITFKQWLEKFKQEK